MSSRIYFIGAITVIALIVFFLAISYGYRVEAKIGIEGDNLTVEDCYLAKLYRLQILPEEHVTQGDKTAVLVVTVGENEILRAERQNLGEGIVIIRTGSIPGDIEVGTKLTVTISLYRGAELLSQASRELTR